MENFGEIKVKRNFTILDELIWGYVLEQKIKLVDVVVFAAIKTQNDAKFGKSMADISRIYKITRATTERCISRLRDAELVSITYLNGKADIKSKSLDSSKFEKVPKSLLMSSTLNLSQKAFLLASWDEVFQGYINHSKSSLQRDVFSQYGIGYDWVTSRVNELAKIGLLSIEGRSMKINFETIVDMSDTIISGAFGESAHLENVVFEYEEKTGISRKNIFDYDGEETTDKKSSPVTPKLILPIIEAIKSGCELLKMKPFELTASELKFLVEQSKKIIDSRDGDSKERIIKHISDSITWKANNAARDINQVKFWTKGYFTRKTKNNLASNLYHYEKDLEANPYSRTPKQIASSAKKVSKKKTTNKSSIDWDKMDEIYKV